MAANTGARGRDGVLWSTEGAEREEVTARPAGPRLLVAAGMERAPD